MAENIVGSTDVVETEVVALVSGYIIIQDEGTSPAGEGVLSLTGYTRKFGSWWRRAPLENSFVHSSRAIKRGIKWNREWTEKSVLLIPANFNPVTKDTQDHGTPLSLEEFRKLYCNPTPQGRKKQPTQVSASI